VSLKQSFEPKAITEEARVFGDVSVLLEFLGQRADSLLQSHFDDTRGDLAAPVNRLASPPCKSYKSFLNRLAVIGVRQSGLQAHDQDDAMSVAPAGGDGLSDKAFLSFSRDFLAAVAAPATVESIRVTRAYVEARRRSFWWRLSRGIRRGRSAPSHDDPIVAGAHRLALRVVSTEYGLLTMTVFTLLVSAYAFSGQRIIDSRHQIVDHYDQIDLDVGTLVKDLPTAQMADFNPVIPPPHCDPGYDAQAGMQVIQSGTTQSRVITVAEATNPVRSDVATSGFTGQTATNQPTSAVINARRCTLYWQLRQANEDMTASTLHLVSWTQVVLHWQYLNRVFGIDTGFMDISAGLHEDWCQRLRVSGDCRPALRDLIYHTQEVADSLPGCIALYMLPTLYGCLGAAASVLRALRRKVELSLVTMTDRGRLQQDLILGALCGAIMGLFVGYLGKGEAATGLGLSALALLAGYNVTGALAFLDELSNRIFQPSKAGST
jgi:hypothetical protein